MKRRKFIIGIGSASVGGSALLGSGAFTRVESQRRVKIEVAEDPDAYLGLDGCEGSPNQSYTDLDEDGHLEVEMSPMNENVGETELGEGINSDSRSYFDDVFQICNQGKQPVCVWIEEFEVPTYDGPFGEENRVEFYRGGSLGAESLVDLEDQTVVGEQNSILLDVGECVCVGIATVSKGLSEGDQLLSEFDDEIVINADADGDCFETDCPELSGEYECTLYADEVQSWRRIGTRYRITNDGPATTFDVAIANSPGSWDSGIPIGADTDRVFVSDASVPRRGLVAWDVPDDCIEAHDLETWGEYKDRIGVEDLIDWYESFGSASAPAGAPSDLDDEAVVEVQNIPEQEVDMEDVVGPDENIPDEDFPDMSQEAEDEGWITCTKFNEDL
ncbi:MAG: DUF1102 domain-containing protein [Halobacteriales archaeon]|nr:DUF1102 domain-containing protein [Halobacteriales archaeon]